MQCMILSIKFKITENMTISSTHLHTHNHLLGSQIQPSFWPMKHTSKTTFLQMYQIDLCEEVLASAPNNTSLHRVNM